MIDTFTLTPPDLRLHHAGGGFTLATGPLHAAAIVTAADGLDAGEVSIAVAGGKIPGYRARPKKDGHRPVVLVVQEIFGVHEHIRDLCRRLAHAGYYAIAPSLYARYGDPGKYDLEHAKDLMTDHRQQGAGQRGDERPGFHRGLRQERVCRHDKARHHRLLLGRAHRLALCRAQSRSGCGRGVVRAIEGTRARQSAAAEIPLDLVGAFESAGDGDSMAASTRAFRRTTWRR